ncbi:hypothetical protein G3570_10270 [Balneolaceae bacterium YR4-1]|uniref:ASPIC/UnbV domain-containing protein n=1 Tax=Halalkalibaculum roseum TaxID=2709311 RepID=A0A6M1SPJ2_9BACT|nr:FG-GAP-like repeat-containing protein [Halalkalibaculum roseum]NGP77019.1 hypothetical protein [Halalkalibaculum roseum]
MAITILVAIVGCSHPQTGEWHNETDYRWKEMGSSFHFFQQNGFEAKSPDETGISFTNRLKNEQIERNRNLLNGSGVAAGDIDGDGWIDLYFAKLDGPNKLYKNLGNWQFRDITAQSGLGLSNQFSTGVNFADIDGDSDLDLLVTALGSTNKIFINNGEGQFQEIAGALGTGAYGSMSSTFGDIDRDGDLDLYITNYKQKSAKDIYPRQRGFSDIIKQDDQGNYYIPDHLKPHYEFEQRGDVMLWFETGENDLLYENDGTGNFTEIPFSSGVFEDQDGEAITAHNGWGLHTRFFDINEDGYPDLYVCNDFETPDRIWINDGDGTFTEIDPLAIRHLSLSSMSVDISDINRDGAYDIFVVEMLSRDYRLRSKQLSTMIPLPDTTGTISNRPLYMGNTLFLNRSDNTFSEIAEYSGVAASEWSWATSFLDVDLDGYEDIIVATGNYFDTQDLDANSKIARREQMGTIDPTQTMFEYPSLESQNVAFKNNGNLQFKDKSTEWGFDEDDISHGLASADLDNDGDQDLVFNRLGSEAGLFENKATKPRIRIRLQGEQPNTHGIGSTIEVKVGSLIQKKQVTASGSYLSGSPADYTFAASDDSVMSIRITWPDGSVNTIPDVQANRFYEIIKTVNNSTAGHNQSDQLSTYFKDVSSKLQHEHQDPFFDDFEAQPLLPYRLSQPGPAGSFFDVNKDGFDDLLIGTGKSRHMAYYQNDERGNFKEVSDPALSEHLDNDLSGILGWHDSRGTHIVTGNYLYEDSSTASHSFNIFSESNSDFSRSYTQEIKSNPGTATGPLAMADIDADGDLDLFAGKRFKPYNYPVPVSSHLYINNSGNFEPVQQQENPFEKVGLVSGAVFSDLDLDGYPELLLATEWGPIKIFKNEQGKFSEITHSTIFGGLTGRWKGITTGDFNNDGRLDILATNQGLNDFYMSRDESEKYMLYGNFDNNENTEIIEAHYEKDLNAIVPSRKLRLLGAEIPFIGKQFWSFEQFSNSTLQEMTDNAAVEIDTVEINTAKTMLFLNFQDGFRTAPLPQEIQFASGYSAVVMDFNADGNEDLFLSQNFFGTRTQDRRSDAGRGLLLQGDGTGKFKTVDGVKSGIKVYGEQRAAAVSDYNRDNRIDLLVTQNSAQTKLFENRSSKSALRITLKGGKDNPTAIGAAARLLYEKHSGPLREIKAGSGYWSQNSADLLLGYQNYPRAVQVNWPGGKTDTLTLTQKSDNIIIYKDGTIEYN